MEEVGESENNKPVKGWHKKLSRVQLSALAGLALLSALSLTVGVAQNRQDQRGLAAEISPTSAPTPIPPPAVRSSTTRIPVLDGKNDYLVYGVKQMTVGAGQQIYVESAPFQLSISSWGSGKATNVGNTTRIICADSKGKVYKLGYFGVNVTPTDRSTNPLVRLVFYPDHYDTYTCTLGIRAYSTGWAPGMYMYISSGKPGVISYNSPGALTGEDGPDKLVKPGTTATFLTKILDNVGGKTISYRTDNEISTCYYKKDFNGLCAPSSEAVKSTTIKARLQITPLTAGGTLCAPAVYSPFKAKTITDAHHHFTANHTLVATIPAHCPKAKALLQVVNSGPDYIIEHGPYRYARYMVLFAK